MNSLTFFRQHSKWVAGVLLILATLIVYLPVKDHQFVHLDDDLYHNPHTQEGLTWANIAWALTALEAGFWHPLTWWSHMLDYELFGLSPGGHHLMSLLLHTLNVLLLFGLLHRWTGALWRSFLVAALFALHPLNVESVAWVAERKNVLSTLFWFLTLGAYVHYVRKPHWRRYLWVVVLFVLGLMAKPMLVTLPCVLLLLDYWPLGRLGPSWSEFRQKVSKLLLEKAPLFALSVTSGILAIHAENKLGALPSLQQIPLDARLGNALTSFVAYLGKMVWPTDLAVFYPHPEVSLPVGQVILAILVIGTLTLLVLRGAASYPYLLVGWLWYLGTLLPVSGLIQVGHHSMADRYMYVPLIGVFILMVWGCTQWVEGSQVKKGWGIGACVFLLLGLSINTRLQLAHWQNSVSLFEHAIQSTADNYLAHNNLGTVFLEAGEIDKGMEQLAIALEIKPESSEVLYNLGFALKQKGHLDGAARYFSEALALNRDLAGAHNNLGLIRMAQGDGEKAIQHFSKALEMDPQLFEALNNLGTLLLGNGQPEKAISYFTRSLLLKPNQARAHNNLGAALDLQGHSEEAMTHYHRALELAPYSYLTHNNLGRMFMEKGDLEKAARHFSKVIEIEPRFGDAHFNLGVVRTSQGSVKKAVASFRQALKLNSDNTEAQQRLALLLEKANP
jgi:tetratricopeptide (TPR) repeat protein